MGNHERVQPSGQRAREPAEYVLRFVPVSAIGSCLFLCLAWVHVAVLLIMSYSGGLCCAVCVRACVRVCVCVCVRVLCVCCRVRTTILAVPSVLWKGERRESLCDQPALGARTHTRTRTRAHCKTTVSRIKKIMKRDQEVGMMTQDGVFCLAKATVSALHRTSSRFSCFTLSLRQSLNSRGDNPYQQNSLLLPCGTQLRAPKCKTPIVHS